MSDRLGARRSPTLIPFEELVLVALLAFVPVVFTRATKECFEVPQSALLATGALLLAWRALAAELARITRSGPGAYLRAAPGRVKSWTLADPLGAGVLLFLASAASSTILSPNPRQSLHGAPYSTGGLVVALSTATVYFTSHAVSRGQTAALVRYARAAGFASAVASSYALLQLAGLDPLVWGRTASFGGVLRVFGTLGHPNMLGAYLAMTAPLTVWLASRTKRATERILWALVATVSVVVIVATLSRGAWLALATAALSALILGAWTRRRAAEKGASHRRGAARFPMAAVASLLVVAAAAFFLLRASVGPHVAERVRQIASLSAPTSRSRLYYWQAGLHMAHDHPWTGVGLDAFGTAYPHYRIPEYWGLEWGGLPEKAHNEAIQILATQGVPGAMAALLVVVLAAVAIRRRLGRGDAPAHAGAIATAATLVAFVVQGLMGFTVVALGSLAAAMAGWITSAPSSGKSDRPGQPRRGHSTAALVLAGIPVAVLFVTLVILPIRTQVHEKEALRAPEGSPERAWALERAVRDAPWDARYPNLLGTSLLTQYLREPGASRGREWLRRAAQAQRTAIATEPWNAYYRAALGRVEMAQAMLRPPEATAADVCSAFREAVAREPVNPGLREQASEALRDFGQRGEAREIALREASLYPSLGQPMAFLGYEALLDQRWKDAADTLEIALRRDWRTEKVAQAAAYGNLAAAYLELGRDAEALRAAEEGLRWNPQDAQDAANRKMALERLGTDDAARRR